MMIPIINYLILAVILLALGLYGIMVKRNAIRMLFSIELIYNAVNITVIALARFFQPTAIIGQIVVLFTIAIAATEAALGLALILVIYRLYGDIDIRELSKLKG